MATTNLEEMTEAIARMNNWYFDGDMVDTPFHDKTEAARAYANADRARNDATVYALASIAESLARIAEHMDARPALIDSVAAATIVGAYQE